MKLFTYILSKVELKHPALLPWHSLIIIERPTLLSNIIHIEGANRLVTRHVGVGVEHCETCSLETTFLSLDALVAGHADASS